MLACCRLYFVAFADSCAVKVNKSMSTMRGKRVLFLIMYI